ncbi:unnamed protein product, partial [Symbiodinium sp. KB8]
SYVTGEFEPTGSDPLDEEVGSKDLFDEEDKVSTSGGGDDRDPGEAIVEEESLDAEEESEEADTGAGVGPIPLDIKAPKATYLLFAEPLLNDKGPTIASAIQSIVTDEEDFVDVWIGEALLACGRQSSGVNAEGKGAETGNPDDVGDSSGRGHSPDLEHHEGGPKGRGHSPDYRDSSNGVEDERVVLAPRVAVRDGKLVLEHYDDDLPSDQEDACVLSQGIGEARGDHGDRSPRVAVLEHNPDHELDKDDSHGDQEKIRDPEVYAQLVLKQGLKVDESVVEYLFELLPDQRISKKTDDCAHAGSPPKAWASGVYRHGGVLGVRNSTKDYPLATKVVSLFIQEQLGEHACWSTFSVHRNLNVKKHRDSHNARDKASCLIPISDFKDGGLWVQLKTGEEVKEEDVVILDGDRGNEGGEVQEPQQVEVELEPPEAVLHIRMTEQEWNIASARYGPNHFIEGMAESWEQIDPVDNDPNSVIPAAIVGDIERDWVQEPRIFLVDDDGEELRLGRMLAMTTTRVPNFEPGGMSSDWLKVCKVYKAVVNVEEMIVLWIHRRIALHPVESDEPRADGGNPPIPAMDFRGGIPRLAMMCARDVNDLMKFVEVAEGETSEEDDVRMMKASPENIYTPNIEDIVSTVSPESPLKVTHTVDPREVLPVVEAWVPAMEAELAALDKMAAIKRCKGPEAQRMRKDPNVVIVPSKLVFTVKSGLEPGKIRRKVRCVACGNFSGESAEELGDVYSAGATIDLVRICLAEKNAHQGTKSISGSLVLWKGVAICWRAANQSLTALSSAEAELITLSEGAQLLRSVKTTLEDTGIRPEMCELRVDATATIAVASSGGSWRTRHLRLREHWLSELVNSDEYQLMHQPGLHQLADGLTKQLTSERVWKLMEAWSFFKGNSSEMKK